MVVISTSNFLFADWEDDELIMDKKWRYSSWRASPNHFQPVKRYFFRFIPATDQFEEKVVETTWSPSKLRIKRRIHNEKKVVEWLQEELCLSNPFDATKRWQSFFTEDWQKKTKKKRMLDSNISNFHCAYDVYKCWEEQQKIEYVDSIIWRMKESALRKKALAQFMRRRQQPHTV